MRRRQVKITIKIHPEGSQKLNRSPMWIFEICDFTYYWSVSSIRFGPAHDWLTAMLRIVLIFNACESLDMKKTHKSICLYIAIDSFLLSSYSAALKIYYGRHNVCKYYSHFICRFCFNPKIYISHISNFSIMLLQQSANHIARIALY